MSEAEIVGLAGKISIDPDPMHLASARDLSFADNWNVVFCLTGNRACAASDARAKIDNHSPGITPVLVFVGIVKRFVAGRLFPRFCNSFRVSKKVRQCSGAREIAAVHRVMLLRAGKQMFSADFANSQAIAEPKRVRSAQLVRVESGSFSDATNFGASVTEMERD